MATVAALASCTLTASVSRSAAINDAGRAVPPTTAPEAADPGAAAPARRPTTIVLDPARLEVTVTELVKVNAAVIASAEGPAPTGRITFAAGDRVLADLPVVEGSVTFKNNDLPIGRHDIEVTYSGDATARPATAHLALTIEAPTTQPFAGPGPSVAVVGDSITLGSKDDVTRALAAAGTDAQVVGLYGYTTTSAKPFVDAFIPRAPSIVVIELGTNDISEIVTGLPGRTPEALRARLRALTASFPSACVAVTTVTSHRERGTGPPSNIDPQRWNAVAREHNAWLQATYTNVVEWDATAQAAGAAGEPLVNDDEVHPNAAGARALATLFEAAVARCRAGSAAP